MKAAGEKAELQPPIAALRRGFAQLLAERSALGRVLRRGSRRQVAAAPAHRDRERQGQQRRAADADHRAGPADAEDRRLHQRREDELPERAGGIDDPRRGGAPLARQALHDRTDQDRQAARAGAERADHAERRDELPFRMHKGRRRGADGEHQPAEDDHPARPIAVGYRAEDRLRQPPDKLRDRHREADRDDAQSRRSVEWGDKEADRLPRAHRDEQDRAGRGDHQPRRRGGGRRVHWSHHHPIRVVTPNICSRARRQARA